MDVIVDDETLANVHKAAAAWKQGETVKQEVKQFGNDQAVNATPTPRRRAGEDVRVYGQPKGSVRIEMGAGWPEDQLKEEQVIEKSYEQDFDEGEDDDERMLEKRKVGGHGQIEWDLADKLVELAENDDRVDKIALEDLVPGNPRALKVYEQLKEIYGYSKPEVKVAKSEVARPAIDIDQIRERVAAARGRYLTKRAEIEGDLSLLKNIWGDPNTIVILHPKTSRPPRIRLIDPNPNQPVLIELSFSEWENFLKDKGKTSERPPIAGSETNADERDTLRSQWRGVLEKIEIEGQKIAIKPENILFASDDRVRVELSGLLSACMESDERRKRDAAALNAVK